MADTASPNTAAAPAAQPLGGFVGIDLGVSCVVSSSKSEDRHAVTVNTNDVSGRSTPAAVSYDGKQRHVGMAAEGRLMSAPKQTLSCLPLTLGSTDVVRSRADRYLWLFNVQEDGKLGPVSFDGEEFSTEPYGPLSVLLKVLVSYAGNETPEELCVAVHDFLTEAEVASVRNALAIAGMEKASLLRHSDAVAVAFAHSQGQALLPEGASDRIVAFVDVGQSHGTVSVVRFSRPDMSDETDGAALPEPKAEFLYRKSDEAMGVQSLINALLGEAKSRIETKHKCTVHLKSKAGRRLANESSHCLKQLSMLPDADLGLEAFTPEGPDGPEIDFCLPFTRDALEAAASGMLQRMREVLAEAIAASPTGTVEGVELVGGGSRVPAVQALVRDAVGEAPLRFGLDGASCVATGAAAWAAGRRLVPAVEACPDSVKPEDIEAVKAREARIEEVNSKEVERLEMRNALEAYIYKVRGWLDGKDGKLLKPEVLGPALDKVLLWFEDAEMAEEPTSLEMYAEKLQETEAMVKQEGTEFFEKQAREREESEKALEKAAEEERQRRKELGMDADKDDRHMKKEDRLRLAAKNKDEGNDMFKAQKFDDAIRRYKKAIDHVSRPEVASNMTPDEAEEARKIKVSCHLNSAQCYIKAADTAMASGGKNAAEPFYKKAKSSCDDVLELDAENIKATFRRSLCWEKLGELDNAMKDIKQGLKFQPEDADLKKSRDRLERMLQKQKEGQKKVFSKMFG